MWIPSHCGIPRFERTEKLANDATAGHMWIPSHCGIPRYERTDKLANDATAGHALAKRTFPWTSQP